MGNAIPTTTSIDPAALSGFVPLREALQRADALGVPVALRTAQHWASTKKIAARRRDGKLEVAVDDFIALARARAGADAGASETAPNGLAAVAHAGAGASAGVPARGAGLARPVAGDGDLAADVFALLEEGVPAVDVVRRLRVAPERIAALARSWRELRATAEPIADRIEVLGDRVTAVEVQVGALQAALAAITRVLPPEGTRCAQCARALGIVVACPDCRATGVCPPAPAPAAAS